MRDYGAPYLIFLLGSALFLTVGAFAGMLMPMQLALIVAQLVAFGLVAAFIYKVRPAPSGGWPGLRGMGRLTAPKLVMLVLMAPCFALLANALGSLVIALIPSLEQTAQQQLQSTKALLYPESTWLRVLAITSVVGTAPILEELLFRGVILPEQLKSSRVPWLSLAFNGMLFGLLHASPISMLPLTVLGAFLAQLTWMTRRLWPAILFHSLVNLTNGVILIELVPRYFALDQANPSLTSTLVMVALCGAFCALLWRLIMRTDKT